MKTKLIILFLGLFVMRIVFAFLIWHGDVYNHMDWGIRFFEYGAAKYYAPETNVWSYLWPNQPPGTIYIFAVMRKLFEFIFNIFWWINIKIPPFPSGVITYFESNLYPALLKFPGILSDFAIACLIYRIIKENISVKLKEKYAIFGAVVFLANPVIWYNSSVWGQYDSVNFFLALFAFYLLLKKKPILATTFFALSIYTKATYLIFAPIFFIIWLKSRFNLRKYLLSVLVPLLIIGVLTYPFSQGEPFTWLFNLYKDKIFVEQRQVVTSNAFNIWAGLTGIHQISHNSLFGPLPFKVWGFIIFGISSILPLYSVVKKKNFKTVFWSLVIISISSFSLLTNMHERYLFAFFPLFTILIFFYRDLIWLYIAISFLNLLNLYNFWWVPEIDFIKSFLSYNDGFFSRILGFLSFFLYFLVYLNFLSKIGFVRKKR